LLETRQPTARPAVTDSEKVKISAGEFAIGRADAPLTLVEFADYQCPFCRQFHATAYERLKAKFIDTGKVRFVSRDLPLDIHSNAMGAANASRCAGEQGKFWEMRTTLVLHADKLEPEAIAGYASELGLDMEQFRSCVATQKYVPSIRADMAEASTIGIGGTPSFVLGKTTSGGIEGIKLVGAQPIEAFEKAIAEQLAQ